jgi:hypothetical protein
VAEVVVTQFNVQGMPRNKELIAYIGHVGNMCISCKGQSSSVGQGECVLPSTESYPPPPPLFNFKFTVVIKAEHENGFFPLPVKCGQ